MPPLPPALQLMRSITPLPPLQCRGIHGSFFGLALTFAAKSLEHTANQLWQWAREPNFGVKSFAEDSILSTSWSICMPYRAYYLVGQAIPGRELFSVPSTAAEIAARENGAATVLQKSSPCQAKFKNPLSLLSSALGSGPRYRIFQGNQCWRRWRFVQFEMRTGACVVSLHVWFCLMQ
jgi:hypothetical protein